MKKKKKLKLKKQAYFVLAGFILIIALSIFGIHMYKDYLYKQTNEYKLLEKGYSIEQVSTLQKHLNDAQLTTILEKDNDDVIVSFIEEKYFLWKNLDTYLEYYKEEEDYSINEIVAIVNVHANLMWYEQTYESDPSLKELVNVNKFYALSSDYAPEDMQNISLTYSYGSLGDNQLIQYAYEKFIDLWNAASDAGYYLMVTSSYRDYQSQEEIYNYRKTNYGERKADETAARAGHSEHQTGLVVDMTSTKEPDAESFSDSEAYKWLKSHAHEYGWIERYPEGKTYITGYSPESWHWRYVGEEVATKMYEENITFDEYYAYYIEGE